MLVLLLVLLVLHLVHVVDCARVSAAGHPILAYSRKHHSLAQALLESARLAPVPLLLCYYTVVFRDARINSLVLHCSLEEALATLASDDSIMEAGGFVLADHADLRLRVVSGVVYILGGRELLLLLVLLQLLVRRRLLLLACGSND